MFKKSRQIYFLCYILTYKWHFEYIPLLNICFWNTFINQQAKLTKSLWNRMNTKVWWHLSSPLKCIFFNLECWKWTKHERILKNLSRFRLDIWWRVLCDGGSLFGVSEMLFLSRWLQRELLFWKCKIPQDNPFRTQKPRADRERTQYANPVFGGSIFQDTDLKSCSKNGCIPILS